MPTEPPLSDAEEFAAWASGRQGALLRTALLLTGDRHRAEDLVQDALVKVALRWRRLRDQQPDAYARRILINDHVSRWRRTRREVPLPAHDPVAPDSAVAADRRLLLDRALAALTPRQRAVVVLRFYEDLSVHDAAAALGVTEGTVKSQTHLALRRLREAAPELSELLGEETR